jgi:hypothetical protein
MSSNLEQIVTDLVTQTTSLTTATSIKRAAIDAVQGKAAEAAASALTAVEKANIATIKAASASLSESNSLANKLASGTSEANSLASSNSSTNSAAAALANKNLTNTYANNAFSSAAAADLASVNSLANKNSSNTFSVNASNFATISTSASVAAQTALAGTSSAVAQAANARDKAIAASQVATAANESLAAMSQTLHSGNIVKMFPYDTAKDSDGGAWIQKARGSWFNETLGGNKWGGQAVNELIERGDNLLAFPEEINSGAWSKINVTVTPNTTIAPDGTITADLVVSTVDNLEHRIGTENQNIGLPYIGVSSVYVKSAGETTFCLGDSAGSASATFNLSTGVVSSVASNWSATISPVGNGWYRCTFMGYMSSWHYLSIRNNRTPYIGDGVSGIYVWGFKINKVGVLPATYSASPELVSNGTFDLNVNGWIPSGDATITWESSGRMMVTKGSTGSSAYQVIQTVIGKMYSVYVDQTNGSGGLAYFFVGTTLNSSNLAGNGSGTASFRHNFIALTTTTYIHFGLNTGVAGNFAYVDNYSVKEVTVLATPYVPYSALAGTVYQNTTDGKFYSLNAAYGQTEVFRGISREFPATSMIVAESGRVIVYDTSVVGCPMWMVLSNGIHFWDVVSGRGITSVYAMQGQLYIGISSAAGYSGNGISILNFIAGSLLSNNMDNGAYWAGKIYNFTSTKGIQTHNGRVKAPEFALVSYVVNDIAVTVLDNAPVDPATGLKVPTIAIATTGGISVIKHDGTVANSQIINFGAATVAFDIMNNVVCMGENSAHYRKTIAPAYTEYVSTSGIAGIGLIGAVQAIRVCYAKNNAIYGRAIGIGGGVGVIKEDYTSFGKSLYAAINTSYNTGWQVGDSRLATLADTIAETITASGELIKNGTFDVDTNGWTSSDSLSVNGSGQLVITGTQAGWPQAFQTINNLIIGNRYCLQFEIIVPGSGISSPGATFFPQTGPGYYYPQTVGKHLAYFIATANYLSFGLVAASAATSTATYDNISCKLAVSDRSVKNNGLILNGTLTKAPVAIGANLVAYSGFSNLNYLRQPYSSSLDFGPGDWCIGMWINTLYGCDAANLVQYPEQLENSYWSKNSCSIISNAIVAPDGTTTADKIVENTTNAIHSVSSFPLTGLASGITTAFSVYLKAGERSFASVFSVGNSVRACLRIDLINGLITQQVVSGININSANITPVGNGWFRVSLCSTSAVNINLGFSVSTEIDGTIDANQGDSYLGDGISGIYAWGLKVNQGVSPGLYTVGQTAIYNPAAPAVLRSSINSSIKFGIDGTGLLSVTAYDGVNTRNTITPSPVNTGLPVQVFAYYKNDGSLAIAVNGVEVAKSNGLQLLSISNSTAVLTVGNSFNLDTPFPGTIALTRISATVPSADQIAYAYRTELPLFQPGAQCTIDGNSSVITAMTYDDSTDLLQVGTSWGRSSFKDLLRVESEVSTIGALTSISASNGVVSVASSSSSKTYQPSMSLRTEIKKRIEAARAIGKLMTPFEFDTIGFNATTTASSNSITAVAVTTGTPYLGMGISGTGVPSGTTIVGISGTTYTLSSACTVAGTGVLLGQTTFSMPKGYTAKTLYAGELRKREGATKTWTRSFDGFVEYINFAVSPGNGVWVSVLAARSN